MICEILLPKPIEKTFYYKTLKFLEPGIVVKVEFKNKKITGVVIKTHKEIICIGLFFLASRGQGEEL